MRKLGKNQTKCLTLLSLHAGWPGAWNIENNKNEYATMKVLDALVTRGLVGRKECGRLEGKPKYRYDITQAGRDAIEIRTT